MVCASVDRAWDSDGALIVREACSFVVFLPWNVEGKDMLSRKSSSEDLFSRA